MFVINVKNREVLEMAVSFRESEKHKPLNEYFIKRKILTKEEFYEQKLAEGLEECDIEILWEIVEKRRGKK